MRVRVWLTFGLVAMTAGIMSGCSVDETSPHGPCKLDWKKCADNAEIMNEAPGPAIHAQVACKMAANRLAKFGTPEWPSWPSPVFSTFNAGDSALKTGILILVEKDAKFSNGFGAMAHVEVRCTYDMNADRVVDVTVNEAD